MSSAAVGSHTVTGPLSLMSCVRESSPLQDFEHDGEKNVVSKRKFWNPKRWFRRRNKVSEDVPPEVSEIGKDALRSRSASELSVDEDQTRRRGSSSMHPGLSVSHDSVFHPLNSGSDLELDAAQSSSSLSISQPFVDPKLQTELSERLRLRRGRGDTSEDDEGLPHSPCNSPTTTDHGFLLDKTVIKDLPTKSHSTCSDGSLLSMGSSEMDEDSFGLHSRHSSKLSLHEKRTESDSDLELGPSLTSTPLNHSAAHHRVSVRPKRTYGAPRRKKGQQLSTALPATPEVNEDSSARSISPESINRESVTELYSMSTTNKSSLIENKLKCSSLPVGIVPPTSDANKLNRSKSNAGNKIRNVAHLEEEEKEEKPSLFERIFPRRSGKKKKKEEKIREEVSTKREKMVVEGSSSSSSMTKSYTETSSSSSNFRRDESRPHVAPRSGAASRQRIQPIDIPATPKDTRESNVFPNQSPEKTVLSTSPIHTELENIFKQKQFPSSSPSDHSNNVLHEFPEHSNLSVISSRTEHTKMTHLETKFDLKHEESKSKVKIASLSPLQQRVLSLNDDENDGFKSLTDFSVKISKPVTKSHSFKSSRQSFDPPNNTLLETENEEKEKNKHVTKASSLDSVKYLDEPIHESELHFNLNSNYIKHNQITKSEAVTETVKTQRFERNGTFSESFGDSITISGPSHTAVVNVTNNTEDFTSKTAERNVLEKDEGSQSITVKENQVSITKIHLKHETTEVTKSVVTLPKPTVPEFLNKHLNKVEVRPTSNIVFSMKSPKIVDEQNRPKTLFNFDSDHGISKPPMPRKFSKENLEIIEKEDRESKDENSPNSPSSISQPNRFKKNDTKSSSRKSSVISVTPESPTIEKPFLKSRSISLDSLKSDQNDTSDKSSQDSLDKTEKKKVEPVLLRKKTLTKQKNDEEPELMKVFARRSLKLKDSEIEQIQEHLADQRTRDSDKENNSELLMEDCKINTITNELKNKEETECKLIKTPLCENKKTESAINITKEENEVQLRKPLNNNIFLTQRAVSLNPTKSITSDLIFKKQSSLPERCKTDQWTINIKKEETFKEKVTDEIISSVSKKTDFVNEEIKTETKNFSQRKAEWEKRAQQAQKKTVP